MRVDVEKYLWCSWRRMGSSGSTVAISGGHFDKPQSIRYPGRLPISEYNITSSYKPIANSYKLVAIN